MANQKDTQKIDSTSYGQASFTSLKTLSNRSIYEFVNKKTEKLVTALYMVTDCMDTGDALKGRMRLLGVDLLSDIYKLSTLNEASKNSQIDRNLDHINEIISFINIASDLGYVSEMNTSILKAEFNVLIQEIKTFQTENNNFTFTLDEKMLEVKKSESNILLENKGRSHGNVLNNWTILKDKRTDTMSFTNKKTNSPVFNKSLSHEDIKKTKEERALKIVSLIKDKSSNGQNSDGVSIRDISLSFPECSEKTIQRELNDLIEISKIKKTGNKRWSRYSIVNQ